MERRTFIGTMAGGLLAAPLAAEAQQAGKVARIGYLSYLGTNNRAASPHLHEAFLQGLRDLGYVEGRNLVIEYRRAEGKLERLPALAAELVALKVDVIMAVGTAEALAAKQATSTLPIVFAGAQVSMRVGHGEIGRASQDCGPGLSRVTDDELLMEDLGVEVDLRVHGSVSLSTLVSFLREGPFSREQGGIAYTATWFLRLRVKNPSGWPLRRAAHPLRAIGRPARMPGVMGDRYNYPAPGPG